MKHGVLRSIGHNVADSLASGCCLMIGIYDLDMLEEVSRSHGSISVDFLTDAVSGKPSPLLGEAVQRYRLALHDLCMSHGTSVGAFRHLSARFWSNKTEFGFSVTVEDERGRRTTTDYGGKPGQRIKVLDHLGRLRPKSIAA